MKKLDSFTPYSMQSIDESDKKIILEVLDSNLLTQGPKTIEFEEELVNFTNSKYSLVFNSATSALYCTFYALRVLYCKENLDSFNKGTNFLDKHSLKSSNPKKTYKILTTPISFVATTNMMVANGFLPVFGDINMDGNLDLNSLENLVDADTVAICSIDYAGKSVDVEKFREFVKKHNLIWISDSSHAIGGQVLINNQFKNIGNFADITIFSFHALKPLTTCEGGAISTNSEDFFALASLARSHGMKKGELYSNDCLDLGFNFRMNEISAALGISQLKRLSNFIEKRNEISTLYEELFKDNPFFFVNKVESNFISTRHLFPIILDSKFLCQKEDIVRDLLNCNIGTQVHYRPIYNFSYYKKLLSGYTQKNILQVNSEYFYRAELSIPNHQNLNPKIIKQISDIILFVFEKYSKKLYN